MSDKIKQNKIYSSNELKFNFKNLDYFLKYVQDETIKSVGGISNDEKSEIFSNELKFNLKGNEFKGEDIKLISRVYTGLLSNEQATIDSVANLLHDVNSYYEGSLIQLKLNGLVDSAYLIMQSLDSKREMMMGQRVEILYNDKLNFELNFELEYVLTFEKKLNAEPVAFLSVFSRGNNKKYNDLAKQILKEADMINRLDSNI
jgi:hypothetical protein